MADGNLPTVSIPSFGYTAGTTNIGAGYAAGIAQAGQGIAEGVKGALDVMNRRQNASDMLNAMHQGGILSDKAYQSLYGKGLGAQEQMIGMYANQWILDQANQRALSLARGQGGIDVAAKHAQWLDQYNIARKYGYPPPGQDLSKMPFQFPQNPNPQNPNPQNPNPQVPPASAPGSKPVFSGALPGTQRVKDPDTGQTGILWPSGQFVPDTHQRIAQD